eukprot:CAMPEP_0171261850 /NCGR_PEP_ID=MMETSP0790-20130122/56229_1 /TAXON_ID=2925 /ORGANISM="Alexandrium catenella, Strain OF101" /LENGTH=206 /DNA_ID=CAMNT_0011730315 /DNA_START=65 /DNA_END=682 /DNA_ORIENTATION=+
MTRRTALITGITGQDGSYLAEFLLEKQYKVHGIIRRSSSFNTQRIDHIFDDITLHTGITGQDGSYLAEFLLEKDYEVHGIIRRASSFNTHRIDHIFEKVTLHYGDMVDSSNLAAVVAQVRPDEIYNLAAQSHVKVSFEEPEYTAQADGVGTLRILEAIRTCGLEKTTRFYQASTSELYGKVQEIPQKETTPFYPRSPYAVAKLYGF